VLDVTALQVVARRLGERRQAFDAEHGTGELGEQRALEPRASADLEHALLAREPQHFEVARVHPRLADCLPEPDRQRGVVVGAVPHAGRHEQVSWDLVERLQHGEIADSLALQFFDQPAPRAAELVDERGH
jgi:hypothetical protein